MSRPPDLVDRASLARNRARSARAPADFLQIEAARDVSERLNEVNRRFTRPVIIGPMAALWRDVLVAEGAIADATLLVDDEVLQVAEGAHDLAIHALCLHWANDPVGQLVQTRRALSPDGLAIAVTFGGQSLVELRAALAAAEAEISGGLSPRVLPMGEIRDLGALLQRAGYALPVADSRRLEVTYADPLSLMRDLRAMGETNALNERSHLFLRRDLLARACDIYRNSYPAAGDPSRIRATAEFVFLTGWSPSSDQPQPLRPGSATTRLADVLGTDEISLRDRER